MWLDSSSDEEEQIYCDSCKQLMNERIYINHWKNCSKRQEKHQSEKSKRQLQEQNQPLQKQQQQQMQICPFCGQFWNMNAYNIHLESCEHSKLQCQYCSQKMNIFMLQEHQYNWAEDRGIKLMGQIQQNQQDVVQNEEDNQQQEANIIENIQENTEQVLSLQQIMHTFLFPALKNIDKGIKKKEVDSIAIIQFKEDQHKYETCAICLQDFKVDERIMKLRCGHIYHEPCSKDWLMVKSCCSVCQASINSQDQ